MPNYLRTFSPGGTLLFTLVTHRRMPIFRQPHELHPFTTPSSMATSNALMRGHSRHFENGFAVVSTLRIGIVYAAIGQRNHHSSRISRPPPWNDGQTTKRHQKDVGSMTRPMSTLLNSYGKYHHIVIASAIDRSFGVSPRFALVMITTDAYPKPSNRRISSVSSVTVHLSAA